MRPTLLLRLKDPDETDDPRSVPHQVAVPPSSEAGGVQVILIGDREEQAVIAAVKRRVASGVSAN